MKCTVFKLNGVSHLFMFLFVLHTWFLFQFDSSVDLKKKKKINTSAQVSIFICNMVRIGFGVQFRHCNGQHSHIQILIINHLCNALDWIIKCLVWFPIYHVTVLLFFNFKWFVNEIRSPWPTILKLRKNIKSVKWQPGTNLYLSIFLNILSQPLCPGQSVISHLSFLPTLLITSPYSCVQSQDRIQAFQCIWEVSRYQGVSSKHFYQAV